MTDATELLANPEDTLIIPSTLGGQPVYGLEETPSKASILIFGDTGQGKTFLSASAAEIPAMCPILFLAAEPGSETARTMARNRGWGNDRVYVVEPTATYDAKGNMVSSKWQSLDNIGRDMTARGGVPFKTVIIDPITGVYNFAMEHWLWEQWKGNHDRDIDLPGAAGGQDDFGRDWRKAGSMIHKFVKRWQDLGLHLIMTAHAEAGTDKVNKNISTVKPAFPGKVGNEIPGIPNEVYYIFVRSTKEKNPDGSPKTEHRIQCQPTTTLPSCKSRGDLPLIVIDPTMQKIIDLAHIPV